MILEFQPRNYSSTFLLACLVLLQLSLIRSQKPETILRRNLLSNYNKELLPRENNSALVNVSTYLVIKRIEPKKNFMVTVQANLFATWMDDYLKYTDNPDDIKNLVVTADEVWVPDITIYNVELTTKLFGAGSRCYLYPSGKLSCKRRFSVSIYCQLDYKEWPHDTQVCELFIGAWAETRVNLVTMGKNGYSLNLLRNNPRWLVKNVTVNPQPIGHGGAIYIRYNFELKRKDMGHYNEYVAPAMIIALLSLSPFWLPRDRGLLRIAMTMVTLTLNALFLQHLGFDILGWSGDTVPKIGQFYRDGIYMNLFSVLITAVLRLLCSTEAAVPAYLAPISAFLGSSPVTRTVLCVPPKTGPWHPLAALLDRAAFLAAALIYFLVLVDLVPA
ncbi:acetylcholine receptor subunit alpha-like [Neocloeon triangulifer]|uniref:acetylcholine receptor subunit alpha-like n=1 Tax=Neocloeon triangulifer TaxID=2078957 RepID=UPI00286F521E|nr:acetylcholine receptor subunit alpha-like [Neocloeon triangulifer]